MLPHMLVRYSEFAGVYGPTPTHPATPDWWPQKSGRAYSNSTLDVFPARRSLQFSTHKTPIEEGSKQSQIQVILAICTLANL